jgi:HD-like signal output (HDOD) protein
MAEELRDQIKQKILHGIETLPSLSPAVEKLLTLGNDQTVTPKDLIEVIRTDPILTLKILKLVNSSYFSLNHKVTSLNRALILLGFNTIKNIALSTELVKVTEGSPHNKYFNYQQLWEHMVSVGATGRYIAKETGKPRKNLEEYFIAGLTHDIGDFLLMRFATEEYHRIHSFAEQKNISLQKCTTQVFGFSSSEMGGVLANRWNLQDEIQDVITSFHLNDPENSSLVQTVRIADRFCRKNNLGYVCDQHNIELDQDILDPLGLDGKFFEAHEESILEEIENSKVFISSNKK